MAKALFGHVGLGPDAQLLAEVRLLRDRVRDLESELARLHAENESLVSTVTVEADLYMKEPALA